MDAETTQSGDNVVITGFGLFRDHDLNPSWEAIKDGRLKIDLPNINIITKQIDVSYKAVDQVVSELWRAYKPVLMIHVGLAAFESHIRLEELARHGPYLQDDVENDAPHKELRDFSQETGDGKVKFVCKPCDFDCSKTCFDIERICEKLNVLHQKNELPIPFKKSDDAGLYVCEYIYQTSLKICDRAIFVHVPNVGDRFKLDDITKSLTAVVRLLIEELNCI